MTILRKCTACENHFTANFNNFHPHKGCKNGLNSECRSCSNIRKRNWKTKNKERRNLIRRKNYAEKYSVRHKELEKARAERYPYKTQASILKSGVDARSKSLGFPRPKILASIQFYIDWLVIQSHCECCNIKFAIGRSGYEPRVLRDNAPSIDRFDTSRAYEIDNISLICWRCNNIKRNYQATDLYRVAKWIENRKPNKFEGKII